MTKFRFRLEAALRLRHLKVEEEKIKLQALFGQQHKLEKALAGLQEEQSGASAFVQGMHSPEGGDLRALSLFSIGLVAHRRILEGEMAQLASSIAEQKQRLQDAEKDERILAKLRSKQLDAWNLQVQREIEATAQELWLCSHTKYREGSEGC